MSLIVAALIQYVAPSLIGYLAGHIGGWFHHKSKTNGSAATKL